MLCVVKPPRSSMWGGAVVVLFLVPTCHQVFAEAAEEYRNADFYDNYYETPTSSPEATIPMLTALTAKEYTRVRRYEKPEKKRTLGPQELRDVKGILQDIFANRRIVPRTHHAEQTNPSTSILNEFTDKLSDTSSYKSIDQKTNCDHPTDAVLYGQNENTTLNMTSNEIFHDADNHNIEVILKQPTEAPDNPTTAYLAPQYQQFYMTLYERESGKKEERSIIKDAVRNLNQKVEQWQPADPTNTILTTIVEFLNNSTEMTLSENEIKHVDAALEEFVVSQNNNTKSPIIVTRTSDMFEIELPAELREAKYLTSTTEVTTNYYEEAGAVEEAYINDPLRQGDTTTTLTTLFPPGMMINGTYHTFPPGWPYALSSCRSTESTPFPLNLEGMIWLIANLTYEYDMNLMQKFSEGLENYSLATCGPVDSVEETEPPHPDFENATVVAKCFVCGLTEPQIPQSAYCADAFAGDFLPLVPVDPRARGHIARYRKYCRYLDTREIVEIPEQPRMVYGRFSAGCAVRWTDLSGIYTQRTCRNRRRAVTGNHFGSKRMAKLEMSLNRVDNGCIISPMATLLPLSRGISLYARFHACVCTGAWCNSAIQNTPWIPTILLLLTLYIFKQDGI